MSLSMTASLMLHRPYLRVLQNVGSAEMLERVAFRRVLSAPSTWSNSFLPTFRINAQSVLSARFSSTLPTVAKPSFWASLVPKPLRRGAAPAGAKIKAKKSTEWNPATFFIIILLLIGSMSIQMIALKNGDATFTRRADARITLLKEIIEKVQNGEEVDVEGLLGTGDPKREQEWEDCMLSASLSSLNQTDTFKC